MDNTKELLEFFRAADQSDYETVARLFGPHHQFFSPMGPDPMNAEGHLGMMQGFHTGFSDISHEIEDCFAAGAKVASRGIWHGRHTGEFNGIPATGRSVAVPFTITAEVDNGTITRQWLHFDVMTMLAQLGVVGAPAQAEAAA